MSAWGNRDNVYIIITGTASDLANVNTNATSAVVSNAHANATAFLNGNINAGDYITLASNKYQIKSVDSDTQFTLTSALSTSGNVQAVIQQGPKYIANVGAAKSTRYANIVNINRIFGVDRDEKANVGPASANANATCHTGWVDVLNYNFQGTTRTKAEVLVAMSKNFNANATGNLHAFSDAGDDATFPQTRNEGGLPNGN
mgnify:CR=1 FL=1